MTLNEAAPPSAMTEVLSGALHLPAGVAELTPLGFALSAFPNAIAKAGDHIAKGDDEGSALTKAFASEGVDYLVWNKIGKLAGMIPGAGDLMKGAGQKLARNAVTGSVIGQNALQLLEMNAKSGLIDLVDNVAGLDKASSEEREDFVEWAEEFLSVPGNAKKMLMMLPAHLMMKGSAKVKQFSTAEGRKIAADVKSQRKFVEDFIGKDEARGLSDRDVGNLYRLVSSKNFSEETVREFISSIEGDAGQANLRGAARTAGDVRQGLEDIESLPVKKGESEAYKAMGRKADQDAQNAEHARREKEIGEAFGNNQLTKDGNERIRAEKRRRKADEAADRERAEREAREAAEEQERAIAEKAAEDNKPTIRVTGPEAESAPADRLTEYPEYAEWLRKNGRSDTDKNWNKFVAQNEMDPALKVVRDKKGNPVKPEAKEPEVSEQKPIEKPQGQEGETPELPAPAKKEIAEEAKPPVRETEDAGNPAKTEPAITPSAEGATAQPEIGKPEVKSGGRLIADIPVGEEFE
ncbi:MAG: hypothetical protein IKO55_15595, partial [Kiritimatiellae bacterium]|nr:hypothetical protein [Kiritimatiellia bacterium]